ncbi:MAG: hypothetical protein LAT82_00670 [Nanoarchaeota archaeon]|nr:hypothetical protein [Nanoarchaeota archaeon]
MVFAQIKQPTTLEEIILLGGSLGAGKTTLLSNLIKNDSFNPKQDGLVVMDAAGNIDFQRINTLAEQKGISIENATSACTVFDGPNAAFRKVDELQQRGLKRVVVELSGQMPLVTMKSQLGSKGIFLPKSIYLVDPKNFGLVGAADEIPFTDVIGITKRELTNEYRKLLQEYNENNVSMIQVDKNTHLTLDDFLKEMNKNSQLNTNLTTQPNNQSSLGIAQMIVGGKNPSSPIIFGSGHQGHTHSSNPNWINQLHAIIENPYVSEEIFKRLVSELTENYDRVKGYVAINSQKVLKFDGVRGEVEFDEIKNSDLKNGTILVANQDGKFFKKDSLEEKLSPILDKPENPPVMRIYSPTDKVEEYIQQAIDGSDYDSALGAIEQYKFERGEDNSKSLIDRYAPEIVNGMWDFVNSDSSQLSDAQRILRNVSLLYTIEEFSPNSAHYIPARDKFMQLYSSVSRDELPKLTDEETLEFAQNMFSRYSNQQKLTLEGGLR